MIANRTAYAALLLLVTSAGAAWAQQASDEPAVAVKTDGLPLHVAAKVREKAAQGITPLRQYVWISRSVNQLDLRSLIRQEKDDQVASRDPDGEPPTVTAFYVER
jgi:hypothetical protein